MYFSLKVNFPQILIPAAIIAAPFVMINHQAEKHTCSVLAEGQAATRSRMPELLGIYGYTPTYSNGMDKQISVCKKSHDITVSRENAAKSVMKTLTSANVEIPTSLIADTLKELKVSE